MSPRSVAGYSLGSLFAQCAGQLVAEAAVLLGELPDAGVRGFESPQQGGVGGPLACWNWGRGRSAVCCPQALDFGPQVRLAVEPGPRDARLLGDGIEGDRLSGRVEGA